MYSDDYRIVHQLVINAGGSWVGVRASFETGVEFLMFTNPATRQFLMVPFNPIEYDPANIQAAISEEIRKDNEVMAKRFVTVRASALQRLYKNLYEVAAELENLAKGAKS